MRAAKTLFLPAVSLVAAAVAEEPRRIPATEGPVPRTRAEWVLWEEEQFKRGLWVKQNYPEYAELFDAFEEWFSRLWRDFIRTREPYSVDRARELIDQLYIDHGHPRFNGLAQDEVIDAIRQVAGWPEERLPAAARQVLLAGLIEYVRAGGGQDGPFTQADTAAALWSLGSDDAAVAAMAQELLEDSACWAHEVCGDYCLSLIEREARVIWGTSARLRLYELTSAREEAGYLPRRYLAAVRALRALLEQGNADEDVFARRVRQATELILTFGAGHGLQDDLLCRLLIVYRSLLERRPQIAAKVCEYIQYQLARLPREGRLRSSRHWDFWIQAVGAVPASRLADELRRTVEGLRSEQGLPATARERLDELVSSLAESEAGPRGRPRP
jgi:hypothetical protein